MQSTRREKNEETLARKSENLGSRFSYYLITVSLGKSPTSQASSILSTKLKSNLGVSRRKQHYASLERSNKN